MPAPTEAISEGRFTRDKLARVLAAVCTIVGVDHQGAQLLRFTTNAVFRLAGDPIVIRIAGSRMLSHRVEKVVRVAAWLADHDVRSVRLLPGVDQPVRVGPYLATVWRAVPPGGDPPTPADLATALREIHELPRPPFELGRWAPLDDVRRRLADAEDLSVDDRQFLERRCTELTVRLAALRFPLRSCVVHGDAHLGNLIPSDTGPVLCDFDSTCFGPPEWDLTPLPVGLRRFGGDPHGYRQLARAYGFDVTRWYGFDVLREVRELKLVTSVLPILRSNPDVVPELRRRLDSVRSGDITTGWSRYR